jgi:signal peptidase I
LDLIGFMSRRSSSTFVENVKTIFYALLIAIGIRTIAFEPFNIPSGSMIPTLLIGDYLFVSKYSYGYSRFSLPLGLPLFHGRIFGALPARGDVAVFKLPRDNSTDYIKRIVGLPGDRIQVTDGQLFVNGKQVPRTDLGTYLEEGEGPPTMVRRYAETLPPSTAGAEGRTHDILKRDSRGFQNNTNEYVVPAGHVFAMGDNRDNSQDSRYLDQVGFVPVENLVGRAEFIFFSVDAQAPWWEVWEWPFEIRWSRLFKGIT